MPQSNGLPHGVQLLRSTLSALAIRSPNDRGKACGLPVSLEITFRIVKPKTTVAFRVPQITTLFQAFSNAGRQLSPVEPLRSSSSIISEPPSTSITLHRNATSLYTHSRTTVARAFELPMTSDRGQPKNKERRRGGVWDVAKGKDAQHLTLESLSFKGGKDGLMVRR